MGCNPGNQCVVKEWVWSLSWKQQAVLLSALRGCDTSPKMDNAKPFIRQLRSIILHNGAVENAEFMTSNITEDDLYNFTKAMDGYPIHFMLHLIHAAEVVGYNHPDKEIREWWHHVYLEFVSAFHMKPESKEENDIRLRDGVETCCHKT